VARVEQSGNLFTGVVSACVELIKSLSDFPGLSAFRQIDFNERDLILPTCLKKRFHLPYLVRPNHRVLIGPRRPTQGEKKEQTSSSGSIDKPSCIQRHPGWIPDHSITSEEHGSYLDKGLIWLNNRVSFQIHFGICDSEVEGTAQRSQPIAPIENNAQKKLPC
jgi:hypothetical protein